MAELEVAGIKFRGGKIFLVLTALTTAGGGLWGGFEFYKDYLNMKEQIQSYVAPDLSEFDKNIALTKEEMSSKTELLQTEIDMLMGEMEMMMQEIRLVSDVANELKNDLRQDVRRVEKIVNDVEQQTKEDSRKNAQELKTTIKDIEDDMKKLEDDIKEAQAELEEKVDKRIKRALENPLGAS
jgi:chromosome segregation ATPase